MGNGVQVGFAIALPTLRFMVLNPPDWFGSVFVIGLLESPFQSDQEE